MKDQEARIVKAAINTMNAGWFELRLAQLLGQRLQIISNDIITTLRRWRGKDYFVNSKRI